MIRTQVKNSPVFGMIWFMVAFSLFVSVWIAFNSIFVEEQFQTQILGSDNPPMTPRRFWTSDLHDGTRLDVPTLLTYLGNHVVLACPKGTSGPYPEKMKQFEYPDRPLAPLLLRNQQHSNYISEADIKETFMYYRDDVLMKKTDAFICSFPASMCEMFMPFNRSIIFLPAHRFTLGRCSTSRLNTLIEHVDMLASSTNPKHFVAAMGEYDAQYLNYFTGQKVKVLSTSALFYVGNSEYATSKKSPEILVGPLQLTSVPFENELSHAAQSTATKEQYIFRTTKQIYGRYELSDITKHRAVVLFPYAVLSFGITELYALGIPIFIPDIDFLYQLGTVSDRRLLDPYYCPNLDLTDLPRKNPDSKHPHNPEDTSPEAVKYWLQFADFYTWPHITTFSSFEDLIQKLDSADLMAIHMAVESENVNRKLHLLKEWQAIVSSIEPNREMPTDYDVAVRDLWIRSRIQSE